MMRFFLRTTSVIVCIWFASISMPVMAKSPNQTVPTRTPTPAPVIPPTSAPEQPPAPTTQPASTATAVLLPTHTAVPLMPTPLGGFLPTAVACDAHPTLQAINQIDFTNVRQGPGINYPVTAQLVANEVRLIVGRAADTPWWAIDLDGTQYGWVADDVVTVQGDISNLPILPAPAVNGATATPGRPWQPTTTAVCQTITPVLAATTAATTIGHSNSQNASATAVNPVEAEGLVEVKDLAPVTPTHTTPVTNTATAIPLASAAVPTAVVPPVATDSDGIPTPILAVGAGLLLVSGMAVVILKRR